MRTVFFVFSLVFTGVFLIGCATMEDNWRWSQRDNTIASYENFVNSYPDSPYIISAKIRIEDLREEKAFKDAEAKNSVVAYKEFIQKYPIGKFTEKAKKKTTESDEEALRRTYRIGTIQAYQGFIESYSKSKYLPLARARIDFLKAVEPATLESFKQFITESPNNPFISEAKATFPILWLKERGKIGVLINISKIESWRGIFGGAWVTEEEVRQKVFDGLKKDLEKEGIQAVLLDDLNDPKVKDIQTILVMNYEEEKKESGSHSSNRPTSHGLTGYTTQTLQGAAADNLANALSGILTGSPVNISTIITIKDANTGFEYYSNVPNLNYKVKRDKMVRALEPFRERAIPSLVIAFNDENLIVRQEAAKKLVELKDPRTVEQLVEIFKEGEWSLRIEAAKALGKSGDARAVEPLTAALKEARWEIRLEAAKALKNLKGKKLSDEVEELAEELVEDEKKWNKKTLEMQTAYNKVIEYENKDVKSELKAEAWKYFIETFSSEDNPYSTEDDTMRQKAKNHSEYWTAMKTGIMKDDVTGIDLVFVKGGCYQMGDTFGDGESDEKPVHEVCVDDFYMGKHEVTQGQWKAIMGNNTSRFSSCGDNCPVESVSWNDAQDFITKLNNKTGKNYRLPTEAEWEYAAKNGGKNEKYAGTSSESELGNYAWYYKNSGSKTHPVGQKKPNGLGIYDMSGNVLEWCNDWYDSNYYKNSPKNNPTGPSSGKEKGLVLRGGNWNSGFARYVRASSRSCGTPDGRVNLLLIGFRLARSR